MAGAPADFTEAAVQNVPLHMAKEQESCSRVPRRNAHFKAAAASRLLSELVENTGHYFKSGGKVQEDCEDLTQSAGLRPGNRPSAPWL